MLLIKKIGTLALVILTICSLTLGTNLQVEAVDKAKYEAQKKSIQDKISNITKTLGSANENFEEVSTMSDDLGEELKKLDSEVEKYTLLIGESEKVSGQIGAQIQVNEKTVEDLKPEIRTLISESQAAESFSTVEILFTSKDLSEFLGRINNYAALKNRGISIKDKLEEANKELEINKINQQHIKDDLEATQSLVSSKKESTANLREKYKGDAEKYKQEIVAQKIAIASQNAEANKLQSDYEAQEAKEKEQRRLAQEAANKARAERLAREAAEIKIANDKLMAEAKAKNQPAPKLATVPTTTTTPSNGTTANENNTRISGGTKLVTGSGCFFQSYGDAGFTGSRPASGYISQGFHCNHDGVDIANASGTSIYSIGAGTVVTKSFAGGGYGNYVVVKHNDNAYSLYGHMRSASPLSVGDSVSKGQLVGYMGTTGWSTGNHLHVMVFDSSYVKTGSGCRYGRSKCYKPSDVINF